MMTRSNVGVLRNSKTCPTVILDFIRDLSDDDFVVWELGPDPDDPSSMAITIRSEDNDHTS